MSGFPIIDLVVGLIFIFFVLSIITSSVVEIIMTRMKIRNKFLAKWLLTIFDKKMMQPDGKVVTVGLAIMDHCVTTALSDEGEATSFLDAKNFVSALIEKLTFDVNDPTAGMVQNFDDLLAKIEKAKSIDGTPLLSTELLRTVLMYGAEAKMAVVQAANNTTSATNNMGTPTIINVSNPPAQLQKSSMDIFRGKLECWFDSSMERVTGRMKAKYIRPYTFVAGLLVVVFMNADTIQMSNYLYDHKEESKQFADKAIAIAKTIDTAKQTDPEIIKLTAKVLKDMDTLKASVPQGMPFGWDKKEVQIKGYAGIAKEHFIGWLATVVAIMLGAPFWFDLLNKIANVRSAGTKPPASSATDKKPA